MDFLPQGFTFNPGVYCHTLKKLRHAIQYKQSGMLKWNVVMIHDNARPHTATPTQNLITTFGWEQFDNPPCSPDLGPSDFHLFLHLKSFLAGGGFHDDNEVKKAVTTCCVSQVASFYDEGIQKLVQRCDKCLKMVETMSKNSVRYIHQMAIYMVCNIFLFFLNSPSEFTFWITLILGWCS